MGASLEGSLTHLLCCKPFLCFQAWLPSSGCVVRSNSLRMDVWRMPGTQEDTRTLHQPRLARAQPDERRDTGGDGRRPAVRARCTLAQAAQGVGPRPPASSDVGRILAGGAAARWLHWMFWLVFVTLGAMLNLLLTAASSHARQSDVSAEGAAGLCCVAVCKRRRISTQQNAPVGA